MKQRTKHTRSELSRHDPGRDRTLDDDVHGNFPNLRILYLCIHGHEWYRELGNN